jgi:hypothetical protein
MNDLFDDADDDDQWMMERIFGRTQSFVFPTVAAFGVAFLATLATLSVIF